MDFLGLSGSQWAALSVVVAVLIAIWEVLREVSDRARFTWSEPRWREDVRESKGVLTPVLNVSWSARGTDIAQGVQYEIRVPGQPWRVQGTSKTFEPTKSKSWTVDLITGAISNAFIYTLHTGPVTDRTSEAVPGKYSVRLTWFNSTRPNRKRTKVFSYVVKR